MDGLYLPTLLYLLTGTRLRAHLLQWLRTKKQPKTSSTNTPAFWLMARTSQTSTPSSDRTCPFTWDPHSTGFQDLTSPHSANTSLLPCTSQKWLAHTAPQRAERKSISKIPETSTDIHHHMASHLAPSPVPCSTTTTQDQPLQMLPAVLCHV